MRLIQTLGPRWLACAAGVAAVILTGVTPSAAQDKPDPQSEIGGLTSKFVDVKGVKARYYEYGQGEPLVMIHGGFTAGSSTANVFSRNIPGLAKRFHVFAVDRQASGMTGNPLNDSDYTYQGDVDFIYSFIQTMKLGQVHVMGHSAGGGIAFYLAIEHPDIIRTLTILAIGPESPPATIGAPPISRQTLFAPPRLSVRECPSPVHRFPRE